LLVELCLARRRAPAIFSSQNRFHLPVPRPAERAIFRDRLKGIVMTTGTVKFFNHTKGFGFIQPEDGATDVFVHISAVERAGMRTIVEGQKLSFDVVRDNRSGKSAAENLQAA
jgi:CspA family cold shock protein